MKTETYHFRQRPLCRGQQTDSKGH